MPARSDSLSARRRFLLIVAVLLCAAAGGWYCFRPPADGAGAALARARSAIERADWDVAQAELEALYRLRPGDCEVLQFAAEVAQRRGDTAASIAWLERIPESDIRVFAESRLQAARLAMQAGRPQKTEELLLSALRKDARLADARRLLVRLDLLLLRDTRMREEIVVLDEQGAATWHDLLLFTVGSRAGWATNDHLDWLETCRRQEPGNVEVAAALAYSLMHQNRRAEARQLLRSLRDGGPRDWTRQLVLAEDEIDEGRCLEAGERLAAFSPQADRDPRVWLARGRVSFDQGDWPAAQTAYAAAELLDPYDPAAAYGTARTRLRSRDAAAAESAFEHADRLQKLFARQAVVLQTDEPSPQQYAELAREFEVLGRIREARAAFQQVLETPAAAEPRLASEAQQALDRLRDESSGATSRLTAWQPDVWERLEAAARRVRGGARSAELAGPAAKRSRQAASTEGLVLPSELKLEDVAIRAGLSFEYEYGHSRFRWLVEVLGGGVAVIDYDRDGCPDVFLSQGCPLPVDEAAGADNGRLFRNRGGTAFDDVSLSAGALQRGYGQGCAVGDYDNDGFSDLVVCRYGSVLFYRNHGDGTFREDATAAGLADNGWSTSAAFADFDRDGDLDLYVVHYVQAPFDILRPCGGERHFTSCRPLLYPAEDDTLWENLGDGHWVEIASGAGCRAPDGKGLGVVIADFDEDGWPDIFVGNDTTRNFLWHNRGKAGVAGTAPFSFSEEGVPSGTAFTRDGDVQASMGIACDDADGDGLFDLFVSNYQNEPDTFYRNLGKTAFSEEAHRFGLADSGRTVMGWGAQFLDLDGDRRPDLFAASGHLHEIEQRPLLYWNTGQQRFLNVSASAGEFFATPRLGRSAALIDWNGDRLPDLVVTHQTGPVSLLENRCHGGHRLSIRCAGTTSNRDAEGAVVTVVAGGASSVHRVSAGGGYFAANDNTVLIGTAGAPRVDRLEIRWPSGGRAEFRDLAADASYVVIEGALSPLAMPPAWGTTHD